MAEGGFSVDQFSCPVCLELLRDPVAIPCGHSFCKVCINGFWDQEDVKSVYSCPQCRQTFTPRPVLGRNTMLAEVVEKLRKTELQAGPPAHCPAAGPGDVECDFCTGKKLKAVQSCLACLVSYCETHLQPHYNVPALKKHKLIKASRYLQEQICSEHEKLLEVYCRTDRQCICMMCTMDQHKGHDTVSATAERAEQQKRLVETQTKYQQKIKEREKEHKKVKEAVVFHKVNLEQRRRTKKLGWCYICIERKRSEVLELIRNQEHAVVTRAERVLKQLEEEIAELKKRNTELEELSISEDHFHFLQSFQSLLDPPDSTFLPIITESHTHSFEEVVKSVNELSWKVEELCDKTIESTSVKVKETQITFMPQRMEFQQYCCDLTLDPSTANPYLCLSEGNTVATYSNTYQPYPDNPDRFKDHLQVLCRESVSGLSYWEFEWSGDNGVCVAVSYKSISKKRKSECVFGFNVRSWRLSCSPSGYSFWHNKKETKLSGVSCSSCRIGVFVDYRAGTLSFYSISNTMDHLHTVHTTFTESLYPGFMFFLGSAVKLCRLTRL